MPQNAVENECIIWLKEQKKHISLQVNDTLFHKQKVLI